MTNKDLFHAMQNLEAKYTEEADARAAGVSVRRFGGIRLIPALSAIGCAAACVAVMFGVVRMGRTNDQIQTANNDLSEAVVQETVPTEISTLVTGAADTTKLTGRSSDNAAASTAAGSTQTTAAESEKAASAATASQTNSTKAAAETEQNAAASRTGAERQTESAKQTAAPKTTAAPETTTVPGATQPEQKTPDYQQPTLVCEQVTAHAGETVPVSVMICQNPALAGSGIRIYYDPVLRPKLHEKSAPDSENTLPAEAQKDPKGYFSRLFNRELSDEEVAAILNSMLKKPEPVYEPEIEQGSITAKSNITVSITPDEHMLGVAFTAVEDNTDDGVLFTMYLTVPEDAASGTVYTLTPEIVSWINAQRISYADQITVVSGSITVE